MLSETLALVLNGVWSLESIVEVLPIIRKRCLYILSACRQTKSCGYSWLENMAFAKWKWNRMLQLSFDL